MSLICIDSLHQASFLHCRAHPIARDLIKILFPFFYTRKVKHIISEPYAKHIVHEVDRNQSLIEDLTGSGAAAPRLYPTAKDLAAIKQYQTGKYICISPASVWFTKQFPVSKWVALIQQFGNDLTVYLLGGKGDKKLTEAITANNFQCRVVDLCGQLSFLKSAALMQGAVMNYANDSAPLHFASAMQAPVTAVFCSTVPAFGFGPVNANGQLIEVKERLDCRPCGLHGRKECPKQHFDCAMKITNEQLLWWTLNKT